MGKLLVKTILLVKTLPILQVSSWSLGVHGNPDTPGDGVRWEGTSIRNFCESSIKIGHQEPFQDSTYPQQVSSWSLGTRRTRLS